MAPVRALRFDRLWRRRFIAAGAVWVGIVVVLGLLEMRPHVVALAGIVALGAATGWLLLDVGDATSRVNWVARRAAHRPDRGADARVRRIYHQLGQPSDSSLHALLVYLIDDRLGTVHGVDRSVDPLGAGTILGPELRAFVDVAPPPDALCDPATLGALLSRIEAL
jgi:hypothetical protein